MLMLLDNFIVIFPPHEERLREEPDKILCRCQTKLNIHQCAFCLRKNHAKK